MATQPVIHHSGHVAERLPVSAEHRVLAILAGDVEPGPDGDAAADSLVRLMTRLGWGGLTRDTLEPGGQLAVTPWFVRVTFPGIAPPDAFIVEVATAAGLSVESLAPGPPGSPCAPAMAQSGAAGHQPSRWLLVAPQSRGAVASAVAQLRAAHRIHAVPFRLGTNAAHGNTETPKHRDTLSR